MSTLEQPGLPGERNGVDSLLDGARLAALRELGLLDIPAAESFDRVTRVVAGALHVPVALISLVDTDRQFFLSHHGLGEPWASTRQTPLSHSICRHTVEMGRPLLISDARSDRLVCENQAVRDLDVVAYAGVPLILRDGSAIGALCAIDDRVRVWEQEELAILTDLASTLCEMLELRSSVTQEGLYDHLTGLPNRALLVAHGEQQLQRQPRDGSLVVMCAGLDGFSQINQALGTDRADAILRAAGLRLADSMRSGDVLGRLRGDMFTILAVDIPDEREALALAARVRSSLAAAPLTAADQQLSVSATIGVAIARPDSRAADLISEAANAMRNAKRRHDRTGIAQEGWSRQASSQLRLSDALRGALGRDEFNAVFQPIVNLESGQTTGYETLARWTHPVLGAVSPAEFIPAAEATADIIPIGTWILRAGCTQLATWRTQGAENLSISVNLAPLQLEQPDLAETVSDVLRSTALPGEALILEITEGALLESASPQHNNLRRLRDLGVRIALDDFGTGYSALGYLKRFPIDIIKIDRSFISGLEEERYDAALVQAILTMASSLKIEVIAEGIENRGQHQLLRLLGCPKGQGFLYAKPLASHAIDLTSPSAAPPRP